jgi:ribosomal 30S subunit maturation factor RimM
LSSKKYIQIGQILKPLGTTGELKIEVQDNFFDDFVESDLILLKISERPITFSSNLKKLMIPNQQVLLH